MDRVSMITDEVKTAIGSEIVGPPESIEMGAIRAYAKAIAWPDPPDPLYFDSGAVKKNRFGDIIAPWTFLQPLAGACLRTDYLCLRQLPVSTEAMIMNVLSLFVSGM